jgi:uncharacterized repeat protein (TIGR03803 family)
MATLTTLESFNGGAEGGDPGYGPLLMDANGNLFGTTLSGGTGGGGTVFELVNTGSGYTFHLLASFAATDTVNGNTPFAGLTMDATGNLFGVTQAGGANASGTVFEIAYTGSGYGDIQTLAWFTGTSAPNLGANPTGSLLADADGNLFGTTQSGGDNGWGSVFEMVNTSSGYSLKTLWSFKYSDGAAPTGPLIADADGDLFGTTQGGGAGGQGTVFELVNGASGYTLKTLASFGATGSDSTGSFLYAGLTADARGDLFGATYSGGDHGYGTVFELVNTGSGYDFRTIASLDLDTNGGYIIGGLTVDAQGDVFGTALAGGSGGFGTVFELVPGASGYSLVTVHAFSGADGVMPEGGLLLDAHGNLYGTTTGGGDYSAGTVFEIAAAAPDQGGAAEQAALALKVNGGPGNPIGAAGAGAVAFTVAGLETGDTGVVTFTDQANHTVTVEVAAGQTHYAADLSSLTDGAVSASLQVATNSLGESFTPVAGNVVALDTVAPGQPGAPTDGAVSGGYVNAAHDTAGQTLGGTAEAGAAVAIYDHGGLVTTVVADNTGAWVYNLGTLADGSEHSYAVTATDAAGNTSAMSAALSFTVDTLAPASAVDAATVGGDGVTTVSGSAEAGSTVALYDGDVLVGVTTAGTSGAWSYAVGVLADGASHSYTAAATDAAGNTGPAGVALSYTAPSAPMDTTPPAAPTDLADAAIAGGYVNKAHDTASQSLTGKAEAGAVVTIYDHGVQLGTATANADTGAWSFNLGVLADGARSLTATATDAAGNTGAMSAALSFTVDATAPVPLVTNVTDAGKGQSTVSGTSEAGSTVTLFDSGQKVGVVTAAADGTWSVTLKLNGGATHQFTETAVDLAGNTGASAGSAYWANPANKALVGGSGDDVFIGGKGDTLTGVGGQNHFVFNTGFGVQTVTNFTCGSDQLWFAHALFADASQVIAHARQSGANALITDAAGDQIVLQGVQCASLHAGDFHFF